MSIDIYFNAAARGVTRKGDVVPLVVVDRSSAFGAGDVSGLYADAAATVEARCSVSDNWECVEASGLVQVVPK